MRTDDCQTLLQDGLEMIRGLSDSDYTCPLGQATLSSPGTHVRHVLDYFNCLLAGMDERAIDYGERKRQAETERSRTIALAETIRCKDAIRLVERIAPHTSLDIRTDCTAPWTRSTVARELQFIAGHAVHHFALIRLGLAHRGIGTQDNFGIASSTIAHRETSKAAPLL